MAAGRYFCSHNGRREPAPSQTYPCRRYGFNVCAQVRHIYTQNFAHVSPRTFPPLARRLSRKETHNRPVGLLPVNSLSWPRLTSSGLVHRLGGRHQFCTHGGFVGADYVLKRDKSRSGKRRCVRLCGACSSREHLRCPILERAELPQSRPTAIPFLPRETRWQTCILRKCGKPR